jgi:AcrR family transcriptional regulator
MVYKLARRPSQRKVLFEAATALVSEKGIASLTIENLAQAAGMTKGGVQYHFKTKADLETELLQWLLTEFDSAIRAEAKGSQSGKDWLRAYVTLSAASGGEGERAAFAMLLSFAPDDPRSLPFNAYAQKWQAAATKDVNDEALATIIRLAADSMWLEKIDGKNHNIETVAKRLLQLVELL